ncbi:MAG TPA: hypothetical protein VK498_07450 [Ferruginibacter sp.]|nr:hypothetical protein [Ferruginibacter sp.]
MQIIKILISVILFNASFYNITVNEIGGTNIPLSNYQNKLILVVNIATSSERVSQLGSLQQLQQQFSDSLVIIGFPTNSFGHETRNNSEIKQFCQTNYGVNFLLVSKGAVSGAAIQPVYNWLIKQSENGITNSEVKGDFQKYLINKSGVIVGIFSGSVSPLDNKITSAITANLN